MTKINSNQHNVSLMQQQQQQQRQDQEKCESSSSSTLQLKTKLANVHQSVGNNHQSSAVASSAAVVVVDVTSQCNGAHELNDSCKEDDDYQFEDLINGKLAS
jgi:hypothetical protein